MEIGLSLGSNLGDRLANLKQARDFISTIDGLTIEACSNVYETEPIDVPSEYSDKFFLNAVVIVGTDVRAELLLADLKSIEEKMGRVGRESRNVPRPIDIDIIYEGDVKVRTALLEIPHPRWARRRFVVQPLAELRPGMRVPGETRTVQEVLLTLPAKPKVFLFTPQW